MAPRDAVRFAGGISRRGPPFNRRGARGRGGSTGAGPITRTGLGLATGRPFRSRRGQLPRQRMIPERREAAVQDRAEGFLGVGHQAGDPALQVRANGLVHPIHAAEVVAELRLVSSLGQQAGRPGADLPDFRVGAGAISWLMQRTRFSLLGSIRFPSYSPCFSPWAKFWNCTWLALSLEAQRDVDDVPGARDVGEFRSAQLGPHRLAGDVVDDHRQPAVPSPAEAGPAGGVDDRRGQGPFDRVRQGEDAVDPHLLQAAEQVLPAGIGERGEGRQGPPESQPLREDPAEHVVAVGVEEAARQAEEEAGLPLLREAADADRAHQLRKAHRDPEIVRR